MTRHRTASEKRAQAAAAAAVARVHARADPDPDPDDPTARYPITPTVARAIREAAEAKETNR